MAFSLSSGGASNVKEAAACELIGTKKGAIFSLIYLFKSFCIYSIPHNYVIRQAMLHAIPQTHSSFYPHRFFEVMRKRNTEFKSVFQSQTKTKNKKQNSNLFFNVMRKRKMEVELQFHFPMALKNGWH